MSENSVPNRIALIGTGPISMLKALELADQFPLSQIVLIDSNEQIGGAWYTDKSPLGYEIECGCHIWSYAPKAYNFIENKLGIPLFNMSSGAYFVTRYFRIPYSLKNTIDTYKLVLKLVFTLKWNKIKDLKKDPNIQFKIFGKRNKYPKTGSPELVKKLGETILSKKNISLRLKTEIKLFDIQNNQVIIQTENNSIHEFDKIYFTHLSSIKKLRIGKKEMAVNHRKVDYVHYLIKLNKPLRKKISYLRLINDPVIHRITDISYQTNLQENLLLVGIKEQAYNHQNENNLLNYISKLLKDHRLTDASFQLIKIKTHVFPAFYLDQNMVDELKECKPVVEVMHTTDLMYGICYYLDQSSLYKDSK